MTGRDTFTLVAGGVEVEVERKGVRRLNLHVRPDGTAFLSVPRGVPVAEAQRFLDDHAGWLRDHAAAARGVETPADGLVPLWGRLVPLPEETSELELYRDEILRRLPEAIDRAEAAVGAHATGWQLRDMSSRWGSCTPRTGRIRVNVRLAAYPPTCLDYVLAHELTHLLEPSHNEQFHALLARAYPDEKGARAILRQSARRVAEAAR